VSFNYRSTVVAQKQSTIDQNESNSNDSSHCHSNEPANLDKDVSMNVTTVEHNSPSQSPDQHSNADDSENDDQFYDLNAANDPTRKLTFSLNDNIVPSLTPLKSSKSIPLQVYLRIRPPLTNEKANESIMIIDDDGKGISCHAPNSNDAVEKFQFASVFGPESTQKQVFETAAKPLIDAVLKGHQGLLFAYGITGSGKSYSTYGTDNAPGIIPLTVSNVFERLRDLNSNSNAAPLKIVISYLEVYVEQVYDLLVHPAERDKNAKPVPLKMQSGRNDNTTVVGLKRIIVYSEKECMLKLQQGAANRRHGQTLLNADSSRSHSVFTLELIRCDDEDDEEAREEMHGKISIVDLAGAESTELTM